MTKTLPYLVQIVWRCIYDFQVVLAKQKFVYIFFTQFLVIVLTKDPREQFSNP